MKRFLLSLVMALALMVYMSVPVVAATTVDVTITGTPAYITIGSLPNTYDFGVVYTSTTYDTTQSYFTLSNNSTISVNITISVTAANWTGGDGWGHDDTDTPGASIAGMSSSNGTDAYDVIVKNAAPNKLWTDLPADMDNTWELELNTPTSFTDGVEKTIVVRLTAS